MVAYLRIPNKIAQMVIGISDNKYLILINLIILALGCIIAMLSFNGPVRLGTGEHAVLCLPGDVVYGCSGGVLFIPPSLVVEVVENGAKTQIKDLFGFEMITANRFTSAQIDKYTWTEEMLDMLVAFIREDPRGKEYRHLDWTVEYELARNGDPSDNQSAL